MGNERYTFGKKKKVITEETIEENSGMVSFPTVKQK